MRERVDKGQITESHVSQAEEFGMHRGANKKPPMVLNRVRLSSLLHFIKNLLVEAGKVGLETWPRHRDLLDKN